MTDMTDVAQTWLFAAEEVEAWRELSIKAYKEFPTTNPESTLRELKNTLNLLGVIESKFLKNAGFSPSYIFNLHRERDKREGLGEFP